MSLCACSQCLHQALAASPGLLEPLPQALGRLCACRHADCKLTGWRVAGQSAEPCEDWWRPQWWEPLHSAAAQ